VFAFVFVVVVRGSSILLEAAQFEIEVVVELIKKAVDGICAFRDEVLRSARSAATCDSCRKRAESTVEAQQYRNQMETKTGAGVGLFLSDPLAVFLGNVGRVGFHEFTPPVYKNYL
jgi:hypothetical protein